MNTAMQLLLMGGRFDPSRHFFAPSDPGDWWDPSDLSRMRQDSAGLTAAAVGQPVGWMLGGRDKILRFQTTSANRPTLTVDANGRYRLSYNGTNSWMQTSAVDFSGTDKVTAIAAITKLSDAARAKFLELGAPTATGSFGIEAPTGATPSLGFNSTGTSAVFANIAVGYAAPMSAVLTGQGDIANDIATLRVNGVQAVAQSTDQGTGNYSNAVIYFGARSGTTLFFNGNEYISAIAGAAKTETLIARMERFAAQRAGITL